MKREALLVEFYRRLLALLPDESKKIKGEGSRTTRIGLVNRGKNQSQ